MQGTTGQSSSKPPVRRRCPFAPAGLFALGALAALAACAPLRSLRVQLDWVPEEQFAGWYLAVAEGAFARRGLAPQFLSGPAGTDVARVLASGQAELATMGWTMYRQAVSADPSLKVLAATFQISPRVLMVAADGPLASPRDLAGQTVGIKSPFWETLVRRILGQVGLDPARVRFVPVGFDEMDRFTRGEIAVWTGFAHAEPLQARRQGFPVRLWFADDYGAGAYEQLLVAPAARLAAEPETYRQVLKAWQEGWQAVLRNPAQAAPRLDPWLGPGDGAQLDQRTEVLSALSPLIDTAGRPLGQIDPARWQRLGGRPEELAEL